jgi:hypothetical protein
LADAIAIAINPALVMALIGSLVFMLLEVFYQGQYEIRLQYIFALFVFAAVLIARISMEEGAERAVAFALPLAVVTLLALNRFVQYPGGPLAGLDWLINIGLLGLVWWSAHKLTLDSTFVGDDDEERSGQGLLAAAGWERPAGDSAADSFNEPASSERNWREPLHQAASPRDRPGSSTRDRSEPLGSRPHPHGMWVVYFSLAALPLFGLGSILSGGGRGPRQPYIIGLFVVYLMSGLGLMLSTSFLGLRRYLRSRRLEMPAGIASAWIGVGCVLIAGITALSILLPAPDQGMVAAATGLARWAADSSDQLKTSRFGMGEDGKLEDGKLKEGKQNEGKLKEGKQNEGKLEEGKQNDGKLEEGDGKEAGDDSLANGTRDANSRHEPTDEHGPEGSDRAGPGHQPTGEPVTNRLHEGHADRREDRSGQSDQGQNGEREGRRRESEQRPSSSPPKRTDEPRSPAESTSPAEVTRPAESTSPAEEATPQSFERVQSAIRTVLSVAARIFRYVFFAALVFAAVILVWRQRRSVLDAIRRFVTSIRDLLARCFGWQHSDELQEDEPVELNLAQPAFADFRDPFLTGDAARVTTDELVRYSFAALEAWARDRGLGRQPDETPHELAERLSWDAAEMSEELRALAGLYGLVAYAGVRPPLEAVKPLKELWIRMRRAVIPTAAVGM